MPIPGYPNRPYVRQRFFNYILPVGVTQTPIGTDPLLVAAYCNSFFVSVDVGANVFMGGPGVTINNGLILVGGSNPIVFAIENQRQEYELQDPLLQLAAIANCKKTEPQMIPFVVWDLTQTFLVAAAPVDVRIAYTLAEFV